MNLTRLVSVQCIFYLFLLNLVKFTKMCSKFIENFYTWRLRDEYVRFQTFRANWPHKHLDPKILAKVGFYYIGPEDFVKCAFCNVEIGIWEPEDSALGEHLRWSPNCPLLKRRETGNFPCEPFSDLDKLLPPKSDDVCGPCGIDIRPGSYAESEENQSGVHQPFPVLQFSAQQPVCTSGMRSSSQEEVRCICRPLQDTGNAFFKRRCKPCAPHIGTDPPAADPSRVEPTTRIGDKSCTMPSTSSASDSRTTTTPDVINTDIGKVFAIKTIVCDESNWQDVSNQLKMKRRLLIKEFDDRCFYIAITRLAPEYDIIFWRLTNKNSRDFASYFKSVFKHFLRNKRDIRFTYGYSALTQLKEQLNKRTKFKMELRCHPSDVCRSICEVNTPIMPPFSMVCAQRILEEGMIPSIFFENTYIKQIAGAIFQIFIDFHKKTN